MTISVWNGKPDKDFVSASWTINFIKLSMPTESCSQSCKSPHKYLIAQKWYQKTVNNNQTFQYDSLLLNSHQCDDSFDNRQTTGNDV